MARLIDADALTDAIEHIDWYHISLQGTLAKGANSQIHTPLYKADDIYQALENAPTVDAVEVVRCKDCTEWDKKEQECSHWYGFREKDFCSYGERRADG